MHPELTVQVYTLVCNKRSLLARLYRPLACIRLTEVEPPSWTVEFAER